MPAQPRQPRARIFLVDDHALVREQLTALIDAEPDLVVCGDAEDAPAALARIRRHEPDLIILDVSLKRSSGLDLLLDLKKLQPATPVLVLSIHEESLYAERAFRAGALGYITKEDATANILVAIHRVLRGESYLTGRIAEQIINKSGGARLPTLKEVQI